MNLQNLLELKENITFNISSKDLIEFAETIVSLTIEKAQTQPKEDVFLSIDETMKRLNVCRATLWSWNKKGYLSSHKIGKSVRYKLADIINIENQK